MLLGSPITNDKMVVVYDGTSFSTLMVRVLEVSPEEREGDLISGDDLAILENFIARHKPRALGATRSARYRRGAAYADGWGSMTVGGSDRAILGGLHHHYVRA
jgi:hypothetical protein